VSISAALAAAAIIGAAPAQAQLTTQQSQVPSAVPANFTPNLDGGVNYAMAQVGTTIVAGGPFTTATQHGSSTAMAVTGIAAFSQSTGALNTAFRPSLNGPVFAVLPGPAAGTVYVGGQFSTVNGVKSKGITLLNLSNGSIVTGFKPPVLNGIVYSMRMSGGHLFLTGTFTLAGAATRDGLATLNPTTGALDSYLTVALTGHHNFNGSGANGAVGGRAMDISPDGTKAVIVGDFKNADGVVHDQVVMLDLGATAGTVDADWNTAEFTAACASGAFDSYVEDVSFAPSGSYFAIVATGGGGFAQNTDGTRALCDSASRWATGDTGSSVLPTWVDYTGNDSFWSVAVTGTAIYAGGHERWLNNPNGSDQAQAGAVPRPGLVALDPVSGLPLAWNPGRNPRGAGAYSLLATSQGLYVGSDTNYIGNFLYRRDEIAYFPLAGGSTPAATTTASLPANVYEAGELPDGTSPDDLAFRSVPGNTVAGSTIGALTTVPGTGITWGSTRGAFMVGPTIFYGDSGGNFWKASFDGTTVGTPVAIDPYNDPVWSDVQTGSGQTYRGVRSGYYSELPSVSGAFYSDGRLYYSQAGQSSLYWRYFSPDSGTVGGQEFTVPGTFPDVAGMFLSGSTLYYASRSDGSLHAMSFSDGGTNGTSPSFSPGTDTIVSGPPGDDTDWRSRSLFAFGTPAPVEPPGSTPVSFTAAAHTYVRVGTRASVTTPQAVQAGDTELLYVATIGTSPNAIATPAGWAPVTTQNASPLWAAVFTRTATAGDAGSVVNVSLSIPGAIAVQLADYTGAGPPPLVTAGASDSNRAAHAAPPVAVTAAGSWVVSFWSDKSSSTTMWRLPSAVTGRDQVSGTGGGHIAAALADSGAPVATGTYPAQTASVGTTASGKGAMISLVLVPGS
jgi:hypothetical protein